MKKNTLGIFSNRNDAEKFINEAHNKLSIPNDDISFVYKNTQGEISEVDASGVSSMTPKRRSS